MSKIICEICGTSYPESNAQCPICGCVKPVDTGILTDKEAAGNYTYVRGGHFSKKNVKKRNAGIATTGQPSDSKNSKVTRIVAIIVAALVLVAIAIGVYIFIDKYADALVTDPNAKEESTQESTQEQIPTDIHCTAITVDTDDILFEYIGQQMRLVVSPTPIDTTDIVSYSSEDFEIVTVDSTGMLTALAEGETTITVTCGSVTAQCSVICKLPEATVEIPVTEIKLNRDDFSLFYVGDSWRLYNGEIPVSEITWSSDDEDVAIVELGRVVAVGEGITKVRAVYDGKEYTCIVRVKFKEAN